jgi:hypothetical protein
LREYPGRYCRTFKELQNSCLGEAVWKTAPQRVKVPYLKGSYLLGYHPSTAGHVVSGGNQGGPPPKAKYYLTTDRDEYREGKVKSTPGGE